MTKIYCSRLLNRPKKSLTWAGIEPEAPRLPVSSADHSAIRPKKFKNSKIYLMNDVRGRNGRYVNY